MLPGEIAVVMDPHIGIDDAFRTYALSAGESGLVLHVCYEDNTAALFIGDQIIYVDRSSLLPLEEKVLLA